MSLNKIPTLQKVSVQKVYVNSHLLPEAIRKHFDKKYLDGNKQNVNYK